MKIYKCEECEYSCGCIETCKLKSSECYQNKKEKEIGADEILKFTEWCKLKGYGCYDWNMLIEQYEKEKNA